MEATGFDSLLFRIYYGYSTCVAYPGRCIEMSDKSFILLVEDEEVVRSEIAKRLKERGYDVIAASSGEEAMTTATSCQSIDLVLVDIDLGNDMDGPTAAEMILRDREIPAVFLVSGTEKGIVARTERSIPYGFVAKDCGAAILDAAIRTALALHDAHRSATVHGITETRNMEAILADREIQLSEAMDLARLASWELDPETRTLVFNDRFYMLYGTTAEQEGGYRMSEAEFTKRFVHPEDAMKFDTFVKSNPEKAKAEYFRTNERRIIRRDDGTIRYVLGRMRLARDASGRVRVYGINQDITERKMAEEALKESEEKYRNVFAVENDALFLMNEKTGAILDVNDAASALYQYTRNELMQMKGSDLSAEPEESNRSIKKHQVRDSTRFHRRKDGTIFPVDISASFFTFKGRPVVLEAARDMTELKAAEDELRRHREELEVMVTERTRELRTKSQTVEELNMALKVLLHQLEEDKEALEQGFAANVGTLILPYVEKIRKSRLDEKQLSCIAILEANLKEMISPFAHNLQQINFTPREIQVANLIRDGRTTKEVAEILGVGLDAVNSYRNSIRLKLGLNKTKTNLTVYLQSLG
jgi:PAS domain S-box-containing protein